MRRHGFRMDMRKLLLHSGIIRTFDPARPSAEAMLIEGGRIRWIGNNKDILSIPADEYKLINLSGRTVLPSFTDAHVHLAFFARSLASLELGDCKSYEATVDRVRGSVSNLSRGEWLVGKGWYKDSWSRPRLPHKNDLDRIIPSNPAALFSKDQHLVWTNSIGLQVAGIDDSTPNPDGGKIYRDEGGSATGVLAENAVDLLWNHCARPPLTKALDQLDKAVAECHRKGVTAVGNFDGLENFELLEEYHSRRRLKIRVRQYIPVRFLDSLIRLRLKSGFGDRCLRISGVKLFADGALGSQTALMFEPYSGGSRQCGIEVSTEAEMTAQVRAAASNGIACAIHAIGDRANHQALNAFETLPHKYRALRHRIEHVQVIKPHDLPRFAELGIIASVQPSHCSTDIELVRKYWGRRSKNAYRFRDMIDVGAAVAFGSDAPIEKLDPLIGLYSAVTRKSFDGKRRFHAEQRLSIGEAIAGFTTGGAYALKDESLYGTIALGRSADIIVMSRDPFRTVPNNLRHIEVQATFFEGECVYGWENINE